MTTCSAVVATYRRPERLDACLDGLRSQVRPADEIVVIAHCDDLESSDLLRRRAADWPRLRWSAVQQHGTVAAMNACIAQARGDIVAFVDDDAVPAPDWLARIEATYATDPLIAAVGGRDVIIMNGERLGPPRHHLVPFDGNDVGRIQWFGRMLGNHHLGHGAARDVDVLKGANMSYRRALVLGHGFDERLRGAGAVLHTEMTICLPLRSRGLRVVYDPAIEVTHYPSPRLYGYGREEVRHEEVAASVHNETLALLEYLTPPRRLAFLIWAFTVGTAVAPGLLACARDVALRRSAPLMRLRAALHGRVAALGTWRRPRLVAQVLRDQTPQAAGRSAGTQYPDGHRTASAV